MSTTLPVPSPPTATPSPAPSARSHQSGPIDKHWNDLPESILTPTTSRPVSPLPPTGDFLLLVKQLFSSTSLQPREASQLLDRISKAEISEEHKAEIGGLVKDVVEGAETREVGREGVVGFIKRERGVAAWAMAVRRGVESWSPRVSE